ncbi:MAG: SDR family oxidoreductase [bacterium]
MTGVNGFLGNNIAQYYNAKGIKMIGTDLSETPVIPELPYWQADLTDKETVEGLFAKTRPQIVINTVALVDLDLCEVNRELAYKINVQTAENIVRAAARYGTRMIHISTDHLFDGKESYYSEDATPAPINNYGATKVQAENICLEVHDDVVMVRTNFYGWSHASHKPTFAEWLHGEIKRKGNIRLFTDYYFTPIEVTALIEAIDLVIKSDFKGKINIAGSERCSKYEFGIALAEIFGLDSSKITTEKMLPGSFKVKRQPDLSLSLKKFNELFACRLPGIKDGLLRFKNTRTKAYDK